MRSDLKLVISLNTTIDDLFLIEDLTVRSINVCKSCNLSNLQDVLNYYQANLTFSNLRNCGANTEKELTTLCVKYSYLMSLTVLVDPGEEFIKLPLNLKAMLLRHFDFLSSTLSVRSSNAIVRVLEDYNVSDVVKAMISDTLDFRTLKNVGEKSYSELRTLKLDLINFLKDLVTLKPEELISEHSKLILKTALKNLADDFIDNESIFDRDGKIKLFSMLKLLIGESQFFSPVEKMLFNLDYKIQGPETASYETIAKVCGITRERVRQISVKIDGDFKNYFRFISDLMIENIVVYGVDFQSETIIIDETLVSKINELEDTAFNRLFCAKILNVLSRDRYQIFGDKDLFSIYEYTRFRQKWKQCYLIEAELAEKFDFEALIQDVFARQRQKIDEDYSLHFKGYMWGFLRSDDSTDLDRIQAIIELILFHELEIFVDKIGYLSFEKTTKKSMQEYCYEILERASTPMTIEEISNTLIADQPELTFNPSSVRSTMNREREMFIYFGRTSTYGLRKWETEKSGIKGGTIRDIVAEYLDEQEMPKHISELMVHLLIFRPGTNDKNVMTNLKLDESNRFRFFSGEHVGLKSKIYPKEHLLFKRVNGNNFRMIIFQGMNGWKMERVIDHFTIKYGYAKNQVESILKKKIKEGNITISHDQRLII